MAKGRANTSKRSPPCCQTSNRRRATTATTATTVQLAGICLRAAVLGPPMVADDFKGGGASKIRIDSTLAANGQQGSAFLSSRLLSPASRP